MPCTLSAQIACRADGRACAMVPCCIACPRPAIGGARVLHIRSRSSMRRHAMGGASLRAVCSVHILVSPACSAIRNHTSCFDQNANAARSVGLSRPRSDCAQHTVCMETARGSFVSPCGADHPGKTSVSLLTKITGTWRGKMNFNPPAPPLFQG